MKTVIASYFNEKGKTLHQVRLEDDGSFAADPQSTNASEGAVAVQALIGLVTREEVGLQLARKVRSVSIDDKAPVRIEAVMPTLETAFGATSVQWARAIFTHLKLKPPSLN